MYSSLLLSFTLISYVVHFVNGQTQSFFSKPNLSSPFLLVQTINASLIDDESFIFITPANGNAQLSALIFDNYGTLIWDGFDQVDPDFAFDLTVCYYAGSPHLCFLRGVEFNGYARGNGVILDNTYTEVATVSTGENEPVALDQHEFLVTENGTTVLVTIYYQVQYDASFFAPGVSWVQTGIFQEIDIATQNVNFAWSALDHVNVSQSYVLPNTSDVSGTGVSQDSAWDYFHINSVDKTAEGDYIISSRHTKAIFKINGTDGSIIWQLGGKQSSFTMDYEFNFQHHARIREDGPTMIISLYDNGSDDSNPPPGQTKPGYEPYSSGLVVVVDQIAMTSTLLERYVSPGQQLSTSQGSLQFLYNGNKLIGMGDVPYIVEFTDNSTGDGQVAFYANFTTGLSYRSFKYPWNAKPTAPPDLFVFAPNCSAPQVFYASWNGATAVVSWRFATSVSADGPFNTVGQVPKSGFETKASFTSDASTPYAIAEALDANGNLIRQSDSRLTFIPVPSFAAKCSDTSCGTEIDYTSVATQDCAS